MTATIQMVIDWVLVHEETLQLIGREITAIEFQDRVEQNEKIVNKETRRLIDFFSGETEKAVQWRVYIRFKTEDDVYLLIQ